MSCDKIAGTWPPDEYKSRASRSVQEKGSLGNKGGYITIKQKVFLG